MNSETPEHDTLFLDRLAECRTIPFEDSNRLRRIARRLLALTENTDLCSVVNQPINMDGSHIRCQLFCHHYGNHEADSLGAHVEWNDSQTWETRK